MIQVLEKVPPGKVTQDVGAYYKSILGILNHMLLSNIYWIRHLGKYVQEIAPIAEQVPDARPNSPTDLLWPTLGALKPVLLNVDHQIRNLVQVLPENRFSEPVKYSSSKGGEKTMILWQVLQHLFNHHTHNRGQVAVLLDQLGVENDYSSILWRTYEGFPSAKI
ncbi:MAG: DinB family protein [Promethearchaeota archaeon CR_4]|nr:MAG: DinB family protein [Candidatus Lokiarchaeota archaeon CR_4]